MESSLYLHFFGALLFAIFLHCGFVECQSDELVKAVHKFMDEHSVNGTNLDEWEAPEEMKKEFVYYHSGFDDEDRPIWIAEWGKWNVKKYFDAGGEKLKIYDNFANQFMLRILQSVLKVRTPENPVSDVIIIIDCKGFALDQLSSAKGILYHLNKLTDSLALVKGVGKGYIINTTYLIELVVNMVRPIMGNVINNFEFYGTNKAKWIPRLLQDLPKSQLPPWYGGSPDYKPVAVFP